MQFTKLKIFLIVKVTKGNLNKSREIHRKNEQNIFSYFGLIILYEF